MKQKREDKPYVNNPLPTRRKGYTVCSYHQSFYIYKGMEQLGYSSAGEGRKGRQEGKKGEVMFSDEKKVITLHLITSSQRSERKCIATKM